MFWENTMVQTAREWEGKNTTLDGVGRQEQSLLRLCVLLTVRFWGLPGLQIDTLAPLSQGL